MTCGARGENRAHEVLHLILYSRTLGYSCGVARRCFLVPSYILKSCSSSARIPFAERVRLGQSFKTVGYGCTSCWGDVGAGDAEADVIYVSFIVSVQYIGY